MTDDLKAPERIWAWQEFAQGFPQGAGGWITHQTSGWTEYVRAYRITTLEAALADMTRQRDAAMAGAVRFKPLVWVKHPSVDIWRADTAFGTYKVFGLGPTPSWDFDSFSDLNDKTSKSAESVTAAKAAAEADHKARILSALTPDPDRMLSLTAAAEPVCYLPTKTVEWLDTYDGSACAKMTAVHNRPIKTDGGVPVYRIPANALAALSRIEAQAEARGMRICADIYYTRCCTVIDGDDVYREMMETADATEAAAKGDNNG